MDLPPVSAYMDNEFVRLTPDMDVYEAIALFLKRGITGATVVDEHGRLIGILSEKDCLKVLFQGAYNNVTVGKVSDYMSHAVRTIPPDMDVLSAAEIFLKETFRRFPVVKDGRLVGQITRRDLLRAIQDIMRRPPERS